MSAQIAGPRLHGGHYFRSRRIALDPYPVIHPQAGHEGKLASFPKGAIWPARDGLLLLQTMGEGEVFKKLSLTLND